MKNKVFYDEDTKYKSKTLRYLQKKLDIHAKIEEFREKTIAEKLSYIFCIILRILILVMFFAKLDWYFLSLNEINTENESFYLYMACLINMVFDIFLAVALFLYHFIKKKKTRNNGIGLAVECLSIMLMIQMITYFLFSVFLGAVSVGRLAPYIGSVLNSPELEEVLDSINEEKEVEYEDLDN